MANLTVNLDENDINLSRRDGGNYYHDSNRTWVIECEDGITLSLTDDSVKKLIIDYKEIVSGETVRLFHELSYNTRIPQSKTGDSKKISGLKLLIESDFCFHEISNKNFIDICTDGKCIDYVIKNECDLIKTEYGLFKNNLK